MNPPKRTFLGTVGDWISYRYAPICSQLGTAILVVAGAWLSAPSLDVASIKFTDGAGRLLIVGFGLCLVGGVQTFKQVGRISSLEERSREAERLSNAYSEAIDQHESICQELIREVLSSLATRLGLQDSERISLYGHNGEAFILAGRFSKSPQFTKTGRPHYPDDQGCIGTAWSKGVCFVDNLPDPVAGKREWVEAMERDWNIPKRTANQIVMKSRCIYGCAFDHSSNNRRIAVMIIESIHANGLSAKKITESLASTERAQLVRFLEIMETFSPNLEYARAEGY